MLMVGVCMVVTMRRTVLFYLKFFLLNRCIGSMITVHGTIIMGMGALRFRMASIGIMLMLLFSFVVIAGNKSQGGKRRYKKRFFHRFKFVVNREKLAPVKKGITKFQTSGKL